MTEEKKPYKMSPAVLAAQRRARGQGPLISEILGETPPAARAATKALADILAASLSKESISEVVRLLSEGVDIKELTRDLRTTFEQE
jgi:hypothetical protein